MTSSRAGALLALTLALGCFPPAQAAPVARRIDTLSLPGTPAFVAVARDVLKVNAALSPDAASGNGLVDDALALPSFAPARVAELHARLGRDLARLRAMPWRKWDVDRQIDFRWTYAIAETMDRHLVVERMYRHRPAEWLETTANDLVSVLTWAPERTDALSAITRQIPGMVQEMRRECTEPTRRDVAIADQIGEGLIALLKANPGIPEGPAAIEALTAYRTELAALKDLPEFRSIGSENYAWRLKHAELLGWTPAQLLALAHQRLAETDAELAALKPKLEPDPGLDAAGEKAARDLTQSSLLALYDRIETRNREAIERAGFVTIPAGVGPIHARVTPDPVVPLTGDGGSMNPPPPFLPTNVGWWNVEHLNPRATLEERRRIVREAVGFQTVGMGPYAVHEGVPGHHLQLSIARLNPDPLRSAFQDSVQCEGWALYAEQAMWEHGGLGPSVAAHYNTLRSYRARIRRVVYDVNVETGAWTLQQAADWKYAAAPGKGEVDPDLLRSINWPTQLICYFSGKEQILELRDAYRKKLGSAYSDRRFHDALLAVGSVPYVFARAKLLGEPVPGI